MILLELVMCKYNKHTEIDFCINFSGVFRQIQQHILQ